jgi:hypothetical protein
MIKLRILDRNSCNEGGYIRQPRTVKNLRTENCTRKEGYKYKYCTVGAQSIACAQSIAPSLIGDNICEKNLNF